MKSRIILILCSFIVIVGLYGYLDNKTSLSNSETTGTTLSASDSANSSPATKPNMDTAKTKIEVTDSNLEVNPGQNASITIKTKPGSTGYIEVIYNSGPSTAQGLYSQEADEDGYITWVWKVGTRTAPGEYPVNITVDDQEVSETLIVN